MKSHYALVLIFVLTYVSIHFMCTVDFTPVAMIKTFIQGIAAAALWAWWMHRSYWDNVSAK